MGRDALLLLEWTMMTMGLLTMAGAVVGDGRVWSM
jgi:hypothetical protein